MKVSVITTLYNYANYVGACIESFLSQTMTDSEIVIVDDASTDKPESVIKPYLCDRVIYIPLASNKGYSHAKNVGIKACRGMYIAMLDADDMLTPNSLEIRAAKLDQGYDLVHGPAIVLQNGQQKLDMKRFEKWLATKSYKNIHAQGVMLRKQLHREVGLYDEKMRCKSDREMWARILHRPYRIGWVENPVAIYRKHDKQMHKSKFKKLNNDALENAALVKIERRKNNLSGLEMLK